MLEPVLIVEDDKRDLELTLVALKRGRLANEVVSVRDGAMALDFLERQGTYADRPSGNPAAILLDQKLPKVTGLEVLEHVRASASLRDITVVMLTSSNEPVDVSKSQALGADGYLVKPADLKQYVSAIDNLAVFWKAVKRSVSAPKNGKPQT